MDVATDPAPSTTAAPEVLGHQITRVPDGSIPPQTTTSTTAAPTTTTAPPVPTTVGAAVAPVPTTTAAPAPPPPAPPTTTAPQRTTGSITVELAAADDADRSVSLKTTAGKVIAGPVTATGDPIVFDDLAPGTYDVQVDQVHDDGATTATRTTVTIEAGEDAVLRCDSDTLDCSR